MSAVIAGMLWFDVEEEYGTTIFANTIIGISCGLM